MANLPMARATTILAAFDTKLSSMLPFGFGAPFTGRIAKARDQALKEAGYKVNKYGELIKLKRRKKSGKNKKAKKTNPKANTGRVRRKAKKSRSKARRTR